MGAGEDGRVFRVERFRPRGLQLKGQAPVLVDPVEKAGGHRIRYALGRLLLRIRSVVVDTASAEADGQEKRGKQDRQPQSKVHVRTVAVFSCAARHAEMK